MKFKFFNDTGKKVSVHPATHGHGAEYSDSHIMPLETMIFELPENTYPVVKMWDYDDYGLQILVSSERF